jgi:hypothetical protein
MKQSIDDLFNKKLSDSKAAFNEAHWEDMAKLLDNEKDRKPKGFWFMLSGIAVLALIGIGLIWTLNNQGDKTVASTDNSSIKIDQNFNNKTNKSKTEISKIESGKISSQENTVAISDQKVEQIIPKPKALNNQTIEVRQTANIAKTNKQTNFTNATNQLSTLTSNKENESTSLPISSEGSFTNERGANEKIDQDLGFDSKASLVNSTMDKIESRIEKVQDDLNENSINKINESRERTLTNSPLLNTLSTMLKRGDSLFEFPMPSMTKVNRKKIVFGINLYSINYPYLKSNEQFLIGFGIGPVVSIPLNNGLSINTGLNYQNRGGNFDVLQSTEQIEFSFGRNVMTSQIQPTSLHYFELPLSIRKRTRKNAIGAGVFASYLFNVRANITKRTEGPNPIIMESFNANVLNEGFTVLNYGVSAAYERFLNNRLVFETRLKYYFNEITQKDFELVNDYLLKENQQLNLQIGLKYYFNK